MTCCLSIMFCLTVILGFVTPLISGREKLKREGVYNPKQAKSISHIRASKLVDQGCLARLSHIRDVEIEAQSIGSILVESEFNEIFTNNLPGIPLHRDIDFCINIEPGMRPIFIPPYRIALGELREINSQTQDLLDKGFVLSSSSLQGAPILFVNMNDGNMRMCIDYRK